MNNFRQPVLVFSYSFRAYIEMKSLENIEIPTMPYFANIRK